MGTGTKPPETREEQDRAYNPGDLYAAEQFPEGYVTGGLDQLHAHVNDPANHTTDEPAADTKKNILGTRAQERAKPWVYKGDSGESTGQSTKQKFSAKGFFKKKAPTTLLISLLLGGSGGMIVLISPSFIIVQLKEMLVGDLNDQLGASSLRADSLFRAKLKSMQGSLSVCTNKVSIRCKFSTMSKRQVKRFQKAGFTIEGDSKRFFGRTKPTKMTFPPSAGGTPGATVTNPTELRNALKSSPVARSALRQAFNPRFSTLSDAIAATVFARFKTNKAKKVKGATDEERAQNMTQAVAGATAGINADGKLTDENGKEYVLDENGNRIYEADNPNKFKEIADKNKAVLDDIASKADKAAKTGKKAVSGTLSSGLKGLSLLGSTDTACTVYNASRAVAAASKVARALQLAQFAMFFLNEADEIKNGTAQPEDVAFIGTILTSIDLNKKVTDESSIWQGKSRKDATAKAHDNPYYGKNALDSPGYKVAAYNEAPTLTSRDLQYTIGGGLSGTLSGVLDKISSMFGGRKNIRSACHVAQSWWARSAGLLAGIASAIGSFGLSTVISIGASVAIGFALPYLESALADIITGKVVSGATKGVDAGDAAFSGTAALLGSMAMSRGMKPANKKDLKSYLVATNEVNNDYAEVARYEARSTPFDAMNQYSFLGTVIRKINPILLKSTASFSGALSNLPALLSVAFGSVIPHANADEAFNPDRFSKCNDDGYAELGIDADVFCNVRYVPGDLSIDSDNAAQWMVDKGHIEEDGAPKSDHYKDWIKYCTERTDGWGETSNDDNVTDKDTGRICTDNNNEISNHELDYFSAFFMYQSLNNAMDTDAGYTTNDTAFSSGNGSLQLAEAQP